MATPRICSIDDCGKPVLHKGWCCMHYTRWRNYGDPHFRKKVGNGEARRFFEEVVLAYEGDECLIWPLARCSKGYARLYLNGQLHGVHRLVCQEEHGSPPSPTHEAAHSCGKGHEGCVARRHVSWKTPKENQADRIEHGTAGRGEQGTGSKLTEADVRKIRALKGIMTQREIGALFGVDPSTISDVHTGESWGWLT